MKFAPRATQCSAFSIVELSIASTVTLMMAGGMMVALSTLQRSFRASQHHAQSQTEQTRILDHIALDLRRALSVSVSGTGDAKQITLKIPDYYDATGNPRDPVITPTGELVYGSAAAPAEVVYYKSGASIMRSENGKAAALATNVQDFALDYTDDGKQVVGVSVSFIPKFQLSPSNQSALRSGTTVYATTLLRNKRQKYTP